MIHHGYSRSYRVLRVSGLMFSCGPCGNYLGPCEHFAIPRTQRSRKHMGVLTPVPERTGLLFPVYIM